MRLPAIDLGIMAEHLSTHEGLINKLKVYYELVNEPRIKRLIQVNINMLRNHVVTMLQLINPDQSREVHLPELPNIDTLFSPIVHLNENENDITLELRSTAKWMGMENFNSALMMKNNKVKNIHIMMAYQNVTMQSLYNKIEDIYGEFIPYSDAELQRLTFKKYYHVQNE
ncbi:hypothetical protein ACIQLG_17105 [Terribacillus saccharophilus]|uniref:hypothetical protein n=1 Tax=Terribacillus saccharophilus TaxID=361277 RepID=UPI00380CB98C